MKHCKKILFAISLIFLLLSGCGENVPSLQTVLDGEASFPQDFQGIPREDLLKSWGDPVLSKENHDLWKVNDQYVQAYYENGLTISVNRSSIFCAKVIETKEKTVLVEPEEGYWERSSGDRIYIPLSAMNSDVPFPLSAGDRLEITYNGLLMESYPAQIGEPYSIKLIPSEP